MLYELRIYAIPPGRMRDIEHRMLARVPPLFVRHGIRAVAYWTATAGTRLPAFIYLLEWRGAAHREASWSNFYNDEDWWRIRAETDGGEELVRAYSLSLLTPDPAWNGAFDAEGSGSGLVHDMVLSHVAIARDAMIGDVFNNRIIPHFKATTAASGAFSG